MYNHHLNNNNNNIYSGSSTHRSVFQGGPVIYIYIIHGKLYYAYLKTIKYLQVDYIENNTWVRGNTIFISSVEHDISRVSAANE